MKNLVEVPLIRNRYFYGKLLTAEDLELEQRYGNDKRRLINRYVLGAGIVAGLEVIRVDEYHISLEMGLALDETGREIVVDRPVIKRLSELEGFEEATKEQGAESLYLCVEYEETPAEPVQNIANHSLHTGEETEYNKYREHYHLYVTDEEPGFVESMKDEEPERFIRSRAEKIRGSQYERGIWLARILLVKADDFYMIDKIIPVPFAQWLPSHVQLDGELKRLRAEMGRWREEYREQAEGRGENTRTLTQRDEEWQLAEGNLYIHVGNGKKGRLYFSESIPHGLGLGNVQVVLRVNDGENSYSGAEDIFDEGEQPAAAACRVNRNEGTFVVGIRLLRDVKNQDISVGWTAVRNRRNNEIRDEEKRLFIRPGMVNLKVREDFRLSVVGVNMENTQVKWKVMTKGGGSIDEDGLYHAPNEPGVYEVEAKSTEMPKVRAAVYIIVRE